MLNKLTTVLICSRAFSLPMTIMSWLVIFTYSALVAGHIRYGLLALAGICLAHLAANLLDDYFDYKSLIKQVSFNKKEYLKNSQKTKCRYLISGLIRPRDILILSFIYLAAASIIGLFFFIKCGIGVVYFALIGGIITILYSFMSKIRLSEFAVAVAYGPALFGGVYYVMTKTYSWDAIILSIPSMLVTVTLLYIHTVMDFDFDLNEGHKTVANSFNSQLDSLIVLKWLLILAYVTPLLLCIFDILDWQVFIVWLTIPLAVDLYKSMVDFSANAESIPEHKWYHFPMENMMNAPSFMTRIYQSRNLMIYYSLFLALAIILALN